MQQVESKDKLIHLPLKPFKKILKKHYSGEISIEANLALKDSVSKFADYIAIEAVKEFKITNLNRKKQGLHELKRIDKFSVLRVNKKFLNQLNITNNGKEEKHIDESLSCQDGAEQ